MSEKRREKTKRRGNQYNLYGIVYPGEFRPAYKRYDLWEWYPKTGACPVSREITGRCGAVFDAVYNPVKTKLIQYAEEAGIAAVGGMSMLVLQAVSAHEIWDGDSYADEQINTIISDAAKIVERDFN